MGEGRLADSENAALKGGKAAMSKMEGKIRELEAELAATQSRSGEAMKAYQRAERKAKELNFAQTEDKKNQDRMSELASKLQMKLKTYKHMEGKTALGASSPAKPALHMPEPLSQTRAATSSSHILGVLNLFVGGYLSTQLGGLPM